LYEQYTARHSRNHRVSGLLRGANLQVCSESEVVCQAS
jgi:hypothetical protein